MDASGKLSFGVGTKVSLKTGNRQLKANDQLIAWNFVPENVVSWTLESPAYSRRFKTSVRATGLFVMPTALTIYIR